MNSTQTHKAKKIMTKTLLYVVMSIIAVVTIGPFLWLLSTAMKSSSENIFAYPPSLIPKHPTIKYFIEVWSAVPIARYFVNSSLVAAFTVGLNLIVSALAAYPLARMKFKGKNIIFYAIIGTMMVPFQILMIPLYIFSTKIGLINSYPGLIFPVAVKAFGIFLLRQAFLAIPRELEDSAYIDGCNSFDIWWRILLPLVKPALATVAIFTFMNSWSRFMWPLIVIDDPQYFTLPLGISYLSGIFSANWRLIASGSLISIIPIIIIFLFMQRHFIEGAMSGAVKG